MPDGLVQGCKWKRDGQGEEHLLKPLQWGDRGPPSHWAWELWHWGWVVSPSSSLSTHQPQSPCLFFPPLYGSSLFIPRGSTCSGQAEHTVLPASRVLQPAAGSTLSNCPETPIWPRLNAPLLALQGKLRPWWPPGLGSFRILPACPRLCSPPPQSFSAAGRHRPLLASTSAPLPFFPSLPR